MAVTLRVQYKTKIYRQKEEGEKGKSEVRIRAKLVFRARVRTKNDGQSHPGVLTCSQEIDRFSIEIHPFGFGWFRRALESFCQHLSIVRSPKTTHFQS